MSHSTCMTVFGYGRRLLATACCLLLLGACSAIRPSLSPSPPSVYSLDLARPAVPARPGATSKTAPTLLVSAPRAAAGFDSQRLIYLREPHKLEYFARSEWIDTPARMLSPLLVAALADSGAFHAVVQAPSSATGDLRLDTEVLRLQQEFVRQPSRVRFTLRATLVEDATRRVVATREFEAVVDATSEDPPGGVVAANQAVRNVLDDLATFCAEAAAGWRQRR